MNIITLISRILVGVLFIISGLIKANDPLGFSYKLDEYFVVFNMEFLSFSSLFLAMFISVMEVGLGMAVILGVRMRSVAWAMMGMIVFFTFLTFYSAYYNKVTDCGCFGDALKLTPWQSFWKDVVLFVFIGIIFIRRNHISALINEKVASVLTLASFALSAWFTIYCYNHLPIKDFRPYAVGKNILDGITIPPDAKPSVYETKLYYEKNGVVEEFTSKNYPWEDSTWVWKDTKNVLVEQGYLPPIHDFKIVGPDGSDYTEEILSNKNYNFLVVAYDIKKTNRKVQAHLNQFQRNCEKNQINFIGLSGSTPAETELFRHDVEAMYDYYSVDATALKTIVRSNPGLVLLKGGTVIEMWHHNDFPEFKDFQKKYLAK